MHFICISAFVHDVSKNCFYVGFLRTPHSNGGNLRSLPRVPHFRQSDDEREIQACVGHRL